MADVVTSENLAEFNRSRLRLNTPVPEAEGDKKVQPVDKTAESAVSREAHTDGKEKEGEHRKNEFGQRLSDLANARKMAEQREQEARGRADRAEAELAELRKVQTPAKSDLVEPDAAKFTDQKAYWEAVADYRVAVKLRERDQKDLEARAAAESARVAREWQAKVRKASKEIEDYDAVMADAAIPITQSMKEALLESDIGPRMQYFLAKNADELDRLQAMSPAKMLQAFGRLEAKIEAEIDKPALKKDEKETEKPAKKEAEPAKRKVPEPPEPITPLVATGGSGGQGIVDANGNVTGSYQDYKAARKAGKIR